jgi:hypothetical protein
MIWKTVVSSSTIDFHPFQSSILPMSERYWRNILNLYLLEEWRISISEEKGRKFVKMGRRKAEKDDCKLGS